jgi:hypothetical protein
MIAVESNGRRWLMLDSSIRVLSVYKSAAAPLSLFLPHPFQGHSRPQPTSNHRNLNWNLDIRNNGEFHLVQSIIGILAFGIIFWTGRFVKVKWKDDGSTSWTMSFWAFNIPTGLLIIPSLFVVVLADGRWKMFTGDLCIWDAYSLVSKRARYQLWQLLLLQLLLS